MLLPGRLRILYAAPDPAHAKPAQLRLQHEGHLVDVSPAGTQGLSLWDTGHYDALALGLDVHDNSGFELVQALASRGPLPPTIMIADSDNETIAQEAMKLGADDYVIRDLESRYLEFLSQRIERAVKNKSTGKKDLQTRLQLLKEIDRKYWMLENIGVGCLELDRNLVITYFNAPAEKIFGIKGADLVGRHLLEALPGAQGSALKESFAQAAKEMQPTVFQSRLGSEGHEESYEVRVLPHDEGVSVCFQPCVDRGERKQMTLEVERRFISLMEAAPFGISVMEIDMTFKYHNMKFTEIFGYTLDDVPDKHAWFAKAYPDEEYRNRVFSIWRRKTIASGYVGDIEPGVFTVRCKDGTDKTICFRIAVLEDGRQLVSYEDITHRLKMKKAMIQNERLKAVADMAAGVSHNFNNLLQIVTGCVQSALLTLEFGDPSECKACLEQVLESSEFGVETVKCLQDFAAAQHENRTENGKVCDLSRMVEQALELTRHWLKTAHEKKGIRISVNRRLSRECFVKGRGNELFDVVVNLIKNAVEALCQGGEITISTFVADDRVILQVHDTGIGIAKDNLTRVFEPFFTTKGTEGTGMGLSTCYAIVRRHAGEIAVESQEGEGSTFTVSLPLVREIPRQSAHAETDFSWRLRILVIDDDEAIVDLLAQALGNFGQTVLTSASGPEALEIFQREPVDLVICDLGMPVMSGWHVAKAVKDGCSEKGVARPPFIILTGWHGQTVETEKMADCGVDRIVEKPSDILELLAVIDALVREHEKDSGPTVTGCLTERGG